jgi:hypothetical protein
VFALLFCATPKAEAVVITVGSTDYDVATATGSAETNEFLALLMAQPWWGNFALARDAARAARDGLGVPNTYSNNPHTPYFAYGVTGTGASLQVRTYSWYWGREQHVHQHDNITGTNSFAVTATTVPSSGATAAMLGLALIGVGAVKRKQRRS